MTPAAALKAGIRHHRARRAGAADDLPAVQHHAFRVRLRARRAGGARQQSAAPGAARRAAALRAEGGDDHRHDLLHRPAGVDLRGLSLWRVLPQAAGSQHLAGKVQLNATPWYMHSFTWTIAVIACVLAGLIALQSRRRD